MSPFPEDPVRARGPLRLVVSTYPSREAALAAVEGALRARLIACANFTAVESRYRWEGKLESATEVLVVFKTVPKLVGALFRFVKVNHPYRVPEIAEVDVPRADPAYLKYLGETLDPSSGAPRGAAHATRRGGPRGRGGRHPPRTRGRLPRRSKRTGRRSRHPA